MRNRPRRSVSVASTGRLRTAGGGAQQDQLRLGDGDAAPAQHLPFDLGGRGRCGRRRRRRRAEQGHRQRGGRGNTPHQPAAGVGRDLNQELQAVLVRRVLRRRHETLDLAGRRFGAIEPQSNPPADVLRVVFGQKAVQRVRHVAVDLLFDLLQLLRVGAPGPALDHDQHDVAALRVSRDEVEDHRVLDARCAELGHHLLAAHLFHCSSVRVRPGGQADSTTSIMVSWAIWARCYWTSWCFFWCWPPSFPRCAAQSSRA